MEVIRSIRKMQKTAMSAKLSGKKIGFVPTMGALHDGHLSLVRSARKDSDIVVVSVFVNPIQFSANEDLSVYPRDIRHDRQLLIKEKVDYLFMPDVSEMYPPDFSTDIREDKLSTALCGKYRPGHFRGVCTVVAKLFNIVLPDTAYFGKKDYQQAAVIKRMTLDLGYNIKIKTVPIVREPDGLAMSSRNVYLSEDERRTAARIYEILKAARAEVKCGVRKSSDLKLFISEKFVLYNIKTQYIEVCSVTDLSPIVEITDKAVILVAVFVGKTRLIDNLEINILQ
ncbi:MAG: pantoate--beta-alanine ligase [Candidatus Omnitrophica bacterium]|nr:pantoate--beta-alanine ligase [Candidatus Omnitrophota bacterium]MDD5441123.1 pantoate--beta-alanine ligase [Candidatus Omnitrophota bacterium]